MSSLGIKNYYNKVSLFFKPQKTTYWNSITECDIISPPDAIPDYYLNFISKADYPDKIDNNGVPVYSRSAEVEIYHPIVIAQYALGLYKQMKNQTDKKEILMDKFLVQANWFKENHIDFENIPVWKIKYDIDEYGLAGSWVSAMAQGEVISVLTRAYISTQDKSYLNLANDALKLFSIPVKDGGVLADFKGNMVYEEYPSPIKTVAVLNGFVFALFGLYDLHLIGNTKATEHFNKGINSLKNLLNYYDTGYWSQYYLFDYPKTYPSSFTYHSLAVEQLKALYVLTNIKTFKTYFEKWESYSSDTMKKLKVLSKKIFSARKLK